MQNVTERTLDIIESFVDKYLQKEDSSCCNKEGTSRFTYFMTTPFSALAPLIDSIVAIVLGTFNLFTGGMIDSLNKKSVEFFAGVSQIIAAPLNNLIRVFNPKGIVEGKNCNGLLSKKANDFFMQKASDFCQSENPLIKHVASRITYFGLLITCVVTRICDLVIGVFATIAVIFTLGQIVAINNVAYRAMHFTGIIGDVFTCTTRMLNPFAIPLA